MQTACAISEPGTGSRRGPAGHTGAIPVVDLQSESERLINASLAVNTANAYNTGLNSLERFRTEYGMVKEWPPAVDTIVLFIAWLYLNGFKYSTARLYVNAIGFQCKMRNCLDISRNFAVQKG